jgi:hypothetical protein
LSALGLSACRISIILEQLIALAFGFRGLAGVCDGAIHCNTRPSRCGGRPEIGLAFRAPQPPDRHWASNLYIAVLPAPIIRAAASGLSPSFTRRAACASKVA